jgi:hypothetical protein
VCHDERFVAADLGRPAGILNSAVLRQPLHGHQLDAALAEVEAFYDAEAGGRVLLWSPWPTPSLGHRGWELEGHPPLLLRPGGLPLDVGTRQPLKIREVGDRADLEAWCRLVVEGFPLEEVQPYRPGALLDERILHDDRFRLLVGHTDGRAVCIGSQFVEHGLNALFLAVTHPDARGQGLYSAMAAHRIADRSDLPAVAIVSDMSRPVLVGRFGFLPLSRFTLWTRPRP